jgi:hypothetical protein
MEFIRYAALRSDAEGKSYFEDRVAELHPAVYVPGIPLVDLAEPIQVSSLIFSRCEPNYVSDWHPAPRRQFVTVLQGGFEVTSGRNETRMFDAGAVFLVEDITGQGHQTRTVGADACTFMTVTYSDGV